MKIKHIAFIMDGNGRWAKSRGLKRAEGHKNGVHALRRVLSACDKKKIAVVSLFAFSTENWKRPVFEVNSIFDLVAELADEYLSDPTYSYRLNFLGDIEGLPLKVRTSIDKARHKTQNNKGMVVNIMLNYGGRAEIVRAAAMLYKTGKNITEKSLSEALYTGLLPEPDIVVRTAGEKRLSNFMIFQSAYSEFVFLDKLWPDMDCRDVDYILGEYAKRVRKFGGV